MKIYNLGGKLIFDSPKSKLREADLQEANLQGADLQEATLQGANLQGANLREANLQWTNLRWANLQGANLQEANLQRANLRKVDLQGANLQGANLRSVDLRRTNFQGADLQEANLQGANLRWANLRWATLQGANLQGANLQGANLQGVASDFTTSYFNLQCPEKGSFIGFKKVRSGFIVELEVPPSALRSSATGRKCRVSKAKVISITRGKESISSCQSNYDENFVYRVGETVEVPDFNKDRWVKCTSGIHLFITKAEAESYEC